MRYANQPYFEVDGVGSSGPIWMDAAFLVILDVDVIQIPVMVAEQDDASVLQHRTGVFHRPPRLSGSRRAPRRRNGDLEFAFPAPQSARAVGGVQLPVEEKANGRGFVVLRRPLAQGFITTVIELDEVINRCHRVGP